LETKLHLRSGGSDSTARCRCPRTGAKLDGSRTGTKLEGSRARAWLGGDRPGGGRCRTRASSSGSGSSLNSSWLFRWTCRSGRGSLGLLELGVAKYSEGNGSGLCRLLLRTGSCCRSRCLSKSWWRTGLSKSLWRTGRLANWLPTESWRKLGTGLGLLGNGESSCRESRCLTSISWKSTRLS